MRNGERRQRPAFTRELSPPRTTYEDIVEEVERRCRDLARGPTTAAREYEERSLSMRRTRDAAVQVELLKEMPRVVFHHPERRMCSRHSGLQHPRSCEGVCAKCMPGQREHTERPI